MRRILFVDDEPNVLEGLERMLFTMRKEWEMAFASSGQEALGLMEKASFDVIVSDMRMPGMDGAELLTEVMKRHPDTVRFVLSGQSDNETVMRSVGPTHQFLAKPCDAKTLKASVDRAFALRDLLSEEAVKRLVSKVGALPSVAHVYAKLTTELQSPEASVNTVGKIIESDVAMTAKVLQLMNSAFFGIRQHVSSATQAVGLLGLDTIKALVLVVGVFSQASGKRLPSGFSLDSLWHHSMTVGMCAQAISENEGASDDAAHDAYTAGVLHDVGVLLLAANSPETYERVVGAARDHHLERTRVESAGLGSTHAEIGAYLLGIWGLPDSIVEAVAFHHCPGKCLAREFSAVTAVHVANVMAHETHRADDGSAAPKLDIEHIKALGLDSRVSSWRETCISINAQREEES